MSRILEFTEPHKIVMGIEGDKTPLYAPCGVCTTPDAVIVGYVEGEDGMVKVFSHVVGPTETADGEKLASGYKHYLAYMCERCFRTYCGEAKEAKE